MMLDQGTHETASPVNGHPGTEVILPGQAVLLDVEAWALRINARWRQSRENIIEAGQLIIDAKASLPYGEFEAMVQTKLAFHPSTARRLVAIAQDLRLRAHVHDLPVSWSTMYELTKLTDEQFAWGLERKIIRPEMERVDVETIRPTPPRVAQPMSTAEVLGATDTGEPAGLRHLNNVEMDGDGDAPSTAGSPASVDRQIVDQAPLPSGARAIMSSRVEDPESLDFFPTPPWATRALFEHVLKHLGRLGHCQFQRAWEPACGEGHMAEVLREYFREVRATDVADYGYGDELDFLAATTASAGQDWIITNPPFGERTEPFLHKAMDLSGTGVALFVRLQWLESVGRYERIFRDKPPTLIAFFAERVPLHSGQWKADGSTATAYIWLVWIKGMPPQAPFWIPPGCRERLAKPDDVKRFGKKDTAEGEAA